VCWRCARNGRMNEDLRAIGAAIQAAARDHLAQRSVSRRALLRGGLTLLALPATQILQACATVPVTGRSQLRLISDEEEARIGVQAFQQLRQEEDQLPRGKPRRMNPS